ncbi:hypothetical protein BCR35DRAFT_336340, partial [Leucosporidium creatinivorum]
TGRSWKKLQTFFYTPSLASTSSFLEALFPPELLESTNPDLDLEDDYAVQEATEQLYLHPPAEVQHELERRARWLKEVWKDGEILRDWDAERKKREKEEAKGAKSGPSKDV